MATATLTYDLNDYDDVQAHYRAIKSLDISLALWEIMYNTKKSFEYQLKESDEKSFELIDKMYERFWEILNDKGVKLDDLIT